MKRLIANIVCTLLLAVVLAPRANAELVHAFDPAASEFPESVAPDHRGNVYVSMTGDRGEIRRFTSEGAMEVVFELDPAPVESFGILGLATDPFGRIYAAVASFNPATHGVWRINPDGGGFRIPGSEEIIMPNDLDFDARGNLYVTDTIFGAVWRIGSAGPDGRPVDLWVQDELLVGGGPVNENVDLGANGIAIDRGTAYVAVTERARVVAVDIQPDGTAGTPAVYAEHPDLLSIDGLDIDHLGRVYGAAVALRGQELGRIMRIRPDTAPEPVFGPADGLQLPTNLAFGTVRHGHQEIWIANWDVAAGQFGIDPQPALLKFKLRFSLARDIPPITPPCFADRP